ncbi:MAG: hypothetical protein ABIQ40_18685 [Bacteroidia bacterium]
MKNTILKQILPFVIGVLTVVLIACCSSPKRSTSEVSVLYDITERNETNLNAAEILQVFDFGKEKWNGATFTFAYVTDVSYNRKTHFALVEGGNRLTASTFTRDKEVTHFRDSVTNFLESLKLDTIGRPHSSVFIPLTEELNRMAESKSKNRVLFVYSDLMENEKSISFYDKKTFALLSNDPGKLKTLLLKNAPLKRLDGITVYFIFQPKNAEQDAMFRLVSGFYKKLLADQGAHVTIAANVALAANQTK